MSTIANIPARTVQALMRWQDHGALPCTFLQAVLRNDLLWAATHADPENLAALGAIARWVYWELPAPSHGSQERIDAWAAKFQRVSA